MGLSVGEVRAVVERVFARQDVLDACGRRDLGAIVAILGTQGVTQGQISELTGIGQGRLSEWMRHKRTPTASSTFEAFADGLSIPPGARQALGLAPVPAARPGPGSAGSAGGKLETPAQAPTGVASPVRSAAAGAYGGGLSSLAGLERVRGELDAVIAVLKVEQGRRNSGVRVGRQAWKNLVFTGPPGSGKSRTAAAVGQAYRRLGVLSSGHFLQVAAADLVGNGPEETGKLVGEAFKAASGGILQVSEAHAWDGLPDGGHQVLRRLYERLSEYRDALNNDLAVILAGQAEPLRRLLHGSPPLAARFRAVIDFPGYTPRQLAAIFVSLADEAGLNLTTAARSKAAAVLARAEDERSSGNARLAVGLLNQATERQARRVAAESRRKTPVALSTIIETDIPDCLYPGVALANHDRPGQYL